MLFVVWFETVPFPVVLVLFLITVVLVFWVPLVEFVPLTAVPLVRVPLVELDP